MHNTRSITADVAWIGASDNRLHLFENVYPIPNGISYNSYLIKDEKTVLADTVDAAVSRQFLENLRYELHGRDLDYVIVHHMEPDHCANLETLTVMFPKVKIVCNAQVKRMVEQFFAMRMPDERYVLVKEGDTLCCGKHTLQFIMAPMVHWPEVMMTYDINDKILFTADAFGTFGALNGNIFADEVDFNERYLYEARRYYTNIVGKYGPQVQNVLKKISALDIKIICPLHGFIWRNNLDFILDKYAKWATYEPEEKGVMIAYGSIYGNTYEAAAILASKLAEAGVKNIQMYDVSSVHHSYIISEAFKYSTLVFASATYNGGIFVNMENLLHDLTAHNMQNRRIALIENGTWAVLAAKLMREEIGKWKNCVLAEPVISLKSALKEEQLPPIESLAKELQQNL